ncbi:MAG TPA: NAD(P)H-quinone oxidoreductase [Candidatus Limnocylindrales bacterium]|nr:NAD(P)H-quinone oxidoreductase [Candidatus Limnocylindrales bacterium]
MRAILFDHPGGPEVLHLGDAPDPQPGPGELLVRVRAAGVNRADLLQRIGKYPPPAYASPILGLEIAGEVVEPAGEWQRGDRVMAVLTGGAYAELAKVPADQALPIPGMFTFTQAAAIPEAWQTAYLNLFTLGSLHAGEHVLIHAAASGVGSAAVQLVRSADAVVHATAGTPAKRDFVRELGAAQVISYHETPFAEAVLEATGGRGVDVVLDFIGAPYWNDHMRVLSSGGRLLLIGSLGGMTGALDLSAILTKSLTIRGTTLRRMPAPQRAALAAAFAAYALPRFADDTLRPVIDTVLPLAQAAEAHQRMAANANIGKIILSVD